MRYTFYSHLKRKQDQKFLIGTRRKKAWKQLTQPGAKWRVATEKELPTRPFQGVAFEQKSLRKFSSYQRVFISLLDKRKPTYQEHYSSKLSSKLRRHRTLLPNRNRYPTNKKQPCSIPVLWNQPKKLAGLSSGKREYMKQRKLSSEIRKKREHWGNKSSVGNSCLLCYLLTSSIAKTVFHFGKIMPSLKTEHRSIS